MLPWFQCRALAHAVKYCLVLGAFHGNHYHPHQPALLPHRPTERPQAEGHILQAARARRRAGAGLHLRRQEGHQPRVQQLPRPDHSSQAARSRAGSHAQVRRRFGRGAHHRRHHEDPHGAGGEDCALQERRSLRGLSVGLHGQCGHGLGDSRQGRLHHLRRAEPRQHHRRRPAVARQDQGLSPQGRGARRRAAERDQERARPQAAHHRRRLLHGRRHRRAAAADRRWPKNTAPS